MYCGQIVTDADHDWDCLEAREAREAEWEWQNLSPEDQYNRMEGGKHHGEY